MFVTAGCPYKVGSQKKSVKETCFIDRVTEHLSIEILTPPPRAKVGECGEFLWYLRAQFAPWWVGDFSAFALHMHSSKWRSEVEI